MIQHNFKKDSRVWLHKNSKRKLTGHEAVKFPSGQQRLNFRNALDEEDIDVSRHIAGADGRMYKKDSRTWLHKSSVRNIAKAMAVESFRKATNEKNPRRMQDAVKKVKMMAAKEMWNIGPIRARDSQGMIRSPQGGGLNVGKRKKNTHRGRSGLASISHRNIHKVQGSDENCSVTCNQCHDKRPRVVRYGKGSYSDNDNINDGSSSDNDISYNIDDDDVKYRVIRQLSEHGTGQTQYMFQDVHSLRERDGLACRKSAAAIEITQEGLNAIREIAREMQLPVQRSSHFVDHANLSSEEHPINHLDNSFVGLSSSKSSLDVSDECLSDHGGVPRAQSDYQLSQATKGLNVRSPPYIQRRYHFKDPDY